MLPIAWIWILQAVITTTRSENPTPGGPCASLCISRNFCDCSSMNLIHFPSRLPSGVQYLDLSNNNIYQINGNDLKAYVQLKILLLQSNEIKTINDDAFNSNRNLEHLDLSYNNLTALLFAWFEPLSSLKVLNLQGNYYRTLGTNSLFTRLPSLKYFRFGNPYFLAIENHNFEGITGLELLELEAINLNSYQNGSLSTFKKITHMVLNVKQDSLFSILGDIIKSVTWLEIRNADFKSPESVAGMDILIPSVVQKLTLRNVSLTDNSVLIFIEVANRYIHVLELDIEECTLYGTGQAGQVVFTGPGSIRVVTIRSLLIPDFFLFSDLHFLYTLPVNMISVTCVDTKVFLVPCEVSRSFKSLQYLDLSNNLLLDLPLKFSFCHDAGGGAWPMLRTLNLSRNSLNHLGSVGEYLSGQKYLTNLDISQNNFGSQMPPVCQWPKTLTNLNISLCQITRINSCIPTTLEILDVSSNALSTFVVRLPWLKELYIAKNKLMRLPSAADLPYLISLTISTNSFNGFSEEELEPFANLRALDARDNNYRCSCSFLSFIHNHKSVSGMLTGWPKDYVCDSPSSVRGIQVEDAHLPVIWCHQTLIVSLICSVVLLVVIIIVVLCYKYHAVWYAKMIWVWLKAKRQPRRVPQEDICYDAFVSYSERDSEWVENIMGHELENANPTLKLCLHKRDFVPGKWIIDNIIDSMEKSRKTLFVLSEYFVQSEWCKYELEFSHFRLIDENNDTVILILLEPIEKETIPKRFCKLRKIMNTKTYLEWPVEESLQHIFWFNLRAALQSDFPTSTQTHPLP